ncbi:MAG: CBS domain-containing protein [Sporichthyaceae bacterium]|nr:CBS domain-containing protein [Sporichthyaceae bacterium]
MRARDLAEDFPTVSLDTVALEAARMLSRERLPGLIVCDSEGRPYTVLPGSQVLRFLVPRYVQDDPRLARVYDEKASDALCAKLTDTTVRDLLPDKRDVDEIPVVDHDATTIEVAAVMARMHSPVVAVVEGDQVLGAITVRRLLDHLLPTT